MAGDAITFSIPVGAFALNALSNFSLIGVRIAAESVPLPREIPTASPDKKRPTTEVGLNTNLESAPATNDATMILSFLYGVCIHAL